MANNGKLKANRRAAMRGYRAGIRSSGLWLQDADHPVFLTYQEIDRMMLDEQVYLGYEMLYAPICTVKIQCQCKDERVKKFVERQFHRFWLHDLFKAFRMIVYGHAGGEVVLEQMGKYLEFSSFVEAHPQDIAPLIHEETGGLWGVRVSGAGMPKTAFLKSPYALWFINEQQFSSWYGRTRLKSVWYAWNEKRGGGAKSASGARKLWFVKNAFDGGMLWYPSKDSFQDPDTGEVINAQDFAMKILEQKETGGVLGLPSDVDETGNKKWSYEPPKVNGQIDGVLDWGDKLDLAILKGWGIPPEVIQASGEPGGGFAGRALPALMFYKREDGLVDSIVYPFDKQVVRHLVRHNFGKVDYEIEPTSLVPKEEPGGGEQPQGIGVPPGQTPGGGGGGGFQDLLGSMSDTAQFSLGNVGSIQMGWDKYDGERGGQGWRDSETGEIRYQKEKPSGSDSKPYEVQESDFVDGVHQVQESDLIKDSQWTKKAIKIGKTILQLSNAVPTATSLLVREAGYSEPVQKVALAIATIGDWSVPGLPVGSALITALTLASSPTLPFKLMKKASKAVSEQIKRMRQKQVKLGLATPGNETILAVGDWLNSAKDFNQALAIFAEALNQTNDVAKALAVAKKVVKTVRLGWEPYEGPKGGKGWHNTETLEVRYQEEKPGGDYVGKSAQPNDEAKKITSDKIRYLNEQSEDPDAEAEEFNSRAKESGNPYRVLFDEDKGEWIYKNVSNSSNKKPSKISKDDLDFIKDYGAGSLDTFAADTRDAFENTDMLDDFENLQELEDHLDWVKGGLWTIGRDNDDIESVLEIADDYGVDRSDVEKVIANAEKPIVANIDKLKSMIKEGVKPIPWGPNHPEYFELPAKPKLPNGVPNPPSEDEYLTEEAYDDDFDKWLNLLPDDFNYYDYQEELEKYESDLSYWNEKKKDAELFVEDDENIKKFWAIKDALVDSLDQAADSLPRKIINIFKNQLAKER